MYEVFERVHRGVRMRQSHGRQQRGTGSEPFDQLAVVTMRQGSLSVARPGCEGPNRNAHCSGMPLAKHQVGGKVSRAPASTKRRSVWSDSVEQIRQSVTLSLGKSRAGRLAVGHVLSLTGRGWRRYLTPAPAE